MRAIYCLLAMVAVAGPSLAQELLLTLNREGYCFSGNGGPCAPVPAFIGFDNGFGVMAGPDDDGLVATATPEEVAAIERKFISPNAGGVFTSIRILDSGENVYDSQVEAGLHVPMLGPGLSGYDVTALTLTVDSIEYFQTNNWRGVARATFRFYGREMPPLPGDFNRDGTVDAADVVVWRDRYDTIGALPNGTGSPVVVDADYNLWRANFGHSVESLASGLGSQSIPEPATVLLLWIGCAWGQFKPRRGRAVVPTGPNADF